MKTGEHYKVIGYELALRSRAGEAERALGEACLRRFGTLRPSGKTPVVRSVNGLIFQSRRFRPACRDYRLTREFITPYTPEHNGMIERFCKSLKEECTWLHNFRSFHEARTAISRWIQRDNEQPPHSVLNYQSPPNPGHNNNSRLREIRGALQHSTAKAVLPG